MPDTELLRVIMPEISRVHDRLNTVDTKVTRIEMRLEQNTRPCPDLAAHVRDHPAPAVLKELVEDVEETEEESRDAKKTLRKAVVDAFATVVKVAILVGVGAAAGIKFLGA